MSDSVTPRTLATRLLCPWNSSGKNNGVGCHFLLLLWLRYHCMYVAHLLYTFICRRTFFFYLITPTPSLISFSSIFCLSRNCHLEPDSWISQLCQDLRSWALLPFQAPWLFSIPFPSYRLILHGLLLITPDIYS